MSSPQHIQPPRDPIKLADSTFEINTFSNGSELLHVLKLKPDAVVNIRHTQQILDAARLLGGRVAVDISDVCAEMGRDRLYSLVFISKDIERMGLIIGADENLQNSPGIPTKMRSAVFYKTAEELANLLLGQQHKLSKLEASAFRERLELAIEKIDLAEQPEKPRLRWIATLPENPGVTQIVKDGGAQYLKVLPGEQKIEKNMIGYLIGELRELAELTQGKPLVIDLSEVKELSPTVACALGSLKPKMGDPKHEVVLCALNDELKGRLIESGVPVAKLFTLCRDLEEARKLGKL